MLQTAAQPEPLITEDYREMRRKLHENPNYGVASIGYAHTEAAIRVLPDGRNAHLIQQPPR